MLIEIVNKTTSQARYKELPSGLNPVWFGNDPGCHVVLDSLYVGGEAFALGCDVEKSEGWKVWNRNGMVIQVGDKILTQRNQFAAITTSRVVVQSMPFVVNITFTPEEMATKKDDIDRLPTCPCPGRLVRDIHTAELVEAQYAHDTNNQAEGKRCRSFMRLRNAR